VISLLARVLERPLAVHDVAIEPLDAIVVLGAVLGANDALTPVLHERIAAAAMLYRAGAAPRIVTTGGITDVATRAEAAVVADGLVAAGVPRAAITVEDRAQTTAENARFTAAILGHARVWPARPGILLARPRVWIVTQPFHAKRAARLFARAGMQPHIWHIADSVQYRDRARAARWLVREYGAWAKHLLRRDR